MLKKLWIKLTNKNKYQEIKNIRIREKNLEIYNSKYSIEIEKIFYKISTKYKLNFLHSGHSGDIINTLPLIKELSKDHECNLYINVNKKIDFYYKHPGNGVFLNNNIYNMLYPLLKEQTYLNTVEKYNGDEEIDINFDLLRDLPINLCFDNIKYASVLTGVSVDYDKPFIEVEPHKYLKDTIAIQRTFRYRNQFINYNFLSNYKNIIFIGNKEEYFDLKKQINNLEFYDCENFLDMASVLKSSKFIIANSSVTFPIAQGLLIPRILESCPYFPAAQTHGKNGYNFYFQKHFEKLVEKLYLK